MGNDNSRDNSFNAYERDDNREIYNSCVSHIKFDNYEKSESVSNGSQSGTTINTCHQAEISTRKLVDTSNFLDDKRYLFTKQLTKPYENTTHDLYRSKIDLSNSSVHKTNDNSKSCVYKTNDNNTKQYYTNSDIAEIITSKNNNPKIHNDKNDKPKNSVEVARESFVKNFKNDFNMCIKEGLAMGMITTHTDYDTGRCMYGKTVDNAVDRLTEQFHHKLPQNANGDLDTSIKNVRDVTKDLIKTIAKNDTLDNSFNTVFDTIAADILKKENIHARNDFIKHLQASALSCLIKHSLNADGSRGGKAEYEAMKCVIQKLSNR